MNTKDVVCVILAAGRGARMKSGTPKVLHLICGRPMLEYLLQTAREARFKKTIVVAGLGIREVRKLVGRRAAIAEQRRLLGSGDALRCAAPYIGKGAREILVASGDVPLVSAKTLQNLVTQHRHSQSKATILTVSLAKADGYGRIYRNPQGVIERIVEDAEANAVEKEIKEINVGVYCFDRRAMFSALSKLGRRNTKKEYYLTDVIRILKQQGELIDSYTTKDAEEALGINSKKDLAAAASVVRRKIMDEMMEGGVIIKQPSMTHIDYGVVIGRDTIIRPGVVIEEDVIIGRHCIIGPNSHIRPGCRIADRVVIGNFAEINRTKIGSGSKVYHVCYVGDAVIGRNVNIGAGTITANYDGKKKYPTRIADGAFVGSNSTLVAPLTVGRNAMVGAGSVVTRGTKVAPGTVVVGAPARFLKKRS